MHKENSAILQNRGFQSRLFLTVGCAFASVGEGADPSLASHGLSSMGLYSNHQF